jgi:hypothetical protein
LRAGVGEAIAKIERGGMAALAEPLECLDCRKTKFDIDRHRHRAGLGEKMLKHRHHRGRHNIADAGQFERGLKDGDRRRVDFDCLVEPCGKIGRIFLLRDAR